MAPHGLIKIEFAAPNKNKQGKCESYDEMKITATAQKLRAFALEGHQIHVLVKKINISRVGLGSAYYAPQNEC